MKRFVAGAVVLVLAGCGGDSSSSEPKETSKTPTPSARDAAVMDKAEEQARKETVDVFGAVYNANKDAVPSECIASGEYTFDCEVQLAKNNGNCDEYTTFKLNGTVQTDGSLRMRGPDIGDIVNC